MSSFTSSQRQKIDHFKAVTNIKSDDIAHFALQKTNWDITNCISWYFENSDSLLTDSHPHPHPQTQSQSQSQSQPRADEHQSPIQSEQQNSMIGSHVSYIEYIPGLSSLLALLASMLSYVTPYLSYFGRILSVFGATSSSMRYSEILAEFTQENETFKQENNDIFCDVAFGDLMNNNRNCLFIYFNDTHNHSRSFNGNILSDAAVIDYLRVNMKCWIGDDRNTEGNQLFRQITVQWNERRRPFVCIAGIHPHSRKLVLVHREYVGNYSSPMLFIANVLDHGLQRWEHFKDQQIQRQMLSQSNRNLRETQDREYQRALQMQQQQEQKEQTEQELKQPEQHQTPQHCTHKNVQMIENRMKVANTKIKQLSAMINKSKKDELIRVALRLPNGKRVQHIFCDQNRVESLFDFAECHELKIDDKYIDDFELVCSYPKRIFTQNDKNLTLKNVGMKHSTILFVQEKD